MRITGMRGPYKDFIGRLVRGETPAANPAELELLFHWLAGRRNHAAVFVQAAFAAHGVSPETALRHAIRYLDRTLFAHDVHERGYYRLFGLTPDCDLPSIRARHRHLLQVFHPDRHPEDREWFTRRTEHFNHAYAYLKTHHGTPPVGRGSPRENFAVPVRTRRATHRVLGKPTLNGWKTPLINKRRLRWKLKTYLGTAVSLERRLYVILVLLPVILLIVVYLIRAGTDVEERDAPASMDTGRKLEATSAWIQTG